MGQDLSCSFSEMAQDLDKTVRDVQRKGIVSMMIDEASKGAYAGARVVKPGTPEQTGLPWRNLADQYLDGVMNRGLRRTHMGQIVFAGETIGMEENDEELLESEFELEEGLEIHCRAYWPRAIRNYALGVTPSNQPAYGPEHMAYSAGSSGRNMMQLIGYCYVNDKRIEEPEGIEGSFFHDLVRGHNVAPYYLKNYTIDKERTDWYTYTQTRRWVVLGESDDTAEGQAVIRLGRVLARLPPGEHRVRLELCFRLLPGDENEGFFPTQPTPVSHPIASGSFVVKVTPESRSIQEKLQGENRLPKRQTSIPEHECDKIEDAVWKLFKNSTDRWSGKGVKPEHPIHLVVCGEWQEINEGTKRAPIYKWSIPLRVVSKRRAALGWAKDHFMEILFTAITPNWKKEANFVYISVPLGYETEIPAEFIPEELRKTKKASERRREAREKAKQRKKEEERKKEKEEAAEAQSEPAQEESAQAQSEEVQSEPAQDEEYTL